ncbi:ATP-dependent helicase [Staphylococcus pseudintermedius]|uniref:ATP-dependent helicase n=1 Tax=Staphylococcus pseudintermedius TaxID=283734 RepID=UPI0018EF39B5|nr:ATP-dependent helicase [Staphylococcus pseudintermedius]EGQ2944746.1 ATP-dependent helicase [Staphylococcus pseudintermedius]EGQ3464752.1 ATP-dependent helicase [Staphylococcus pseudintermedius]EGQ3532663.1 ATP-dependent helicase [Staphylococcus pseudintermedius]EGQ3624591.1 ATP-dependent helicase [Staphylococcus pseudintermedius]EGQ3802387.1 ATP-dependent helicase [Staphylococcus pseudintermedius]
MYTTYLKKLEQIKKDKNQLTAFYSNDSTVVKAGPGSGKTTVLTLKMMRLLNGKIKYPRGLACLTFNREAVKEFTQRLLDLGYVKRSNVFLGTVHAFCIAEVIAPYAHLYNYNIPTPLKIVSEKERTQLFNDIVSNLGYNHDLVNLIKMDKERTLNVDGFSSIKVEPYDIALKVAKEFEKQLHAMGMVDFIDIVKYATLLIQKEQYVRKCIEAKFPWILIDEYQDLGRPLHEMMLSLFYHTNIKIFVVGDPDQSIYGFTGAKPDYLNELSLNPNITTIELTTNYRSHRDIINASVIALNQDRNYISGKSFDKEAEFHFVTCEEELDDQYKAIVNQIIPECQEKGIPLDEVCILVQGKKQIKDLSSVLEKNDIPYYISRFEFKRSDTVNWLEKCASWVISKSNESFNGLFDYWINLLKRHDYFISPDKVILERKKLYSLLESSFKYNYSLYKWLQYVILNLELYDTLRGSAIYPDEVDNLKTLLKASHEGSFSDYNITKFSNLGKPVNQVTISTRHSSKGLEFESVVMLGMEKGTFPYYLNEENPEKLNEDRRVFFVCVSRAKRVCYLLRSKKYTRKTRFGLRTFFREPSMFWEEMYQNNSN